MSDTNDKIYGIDPNKNNPENPQPNAAPVDPSNTSDIGQRVEQGVISTHKSITDQSAEWEDKDEREVTANRSSNKPSDEEIKNKQPEELDSTTNQGGDSGSGDNY